MHRTGPVSQDGSLRFPEGGVWALRHPARVRSAGVGTTHHVPMPGDLTTDRVLDEAQRDLEQLKGDLDEMRELLDGVLFRFPGSTAERGGGDWPPYAA